MTYQKRPKPKKTAAVAKLQKPTMAATLLNKVTRSFAPLTKFQKALYYRGLDKKPSALLQWFQRNAAAVALAEKVLIVAFIIFAIFTNAFLLLILPALGAMIFYRNRVKFLWWKLKVFVLKRNFYQHRRELYKMGSLWHHFAHKLPKRFGNAVIWGESESVQLIRFKNLQKTKQLTKKEYIKL